MAYEWKHNTGKPAPRASVLLNLAIGGWAGRNGIDDSKLPLSFDVDNVAHLPTHFGPAKLVAPRIKPQPRQTTDWREVADQNFNTAP